MSFVPILVYTSFMCSFLPMHQPLAYFLRPTTLDQMVGQKVIRQTIASFLEKGQVPSMIFR
jgi:replication-associated recombination protein RarA